VDTADCWLPTDDGTLRPAEKSSTPLATRPILM